MTTLIKIPFAQSGDRTDPPDTSTDGSVNWTSGYGADYSKDPATDTSAKRIEREEFNGILNRLSTALNEIQAKGVASYITSADNGGTAYVYSKGSFVLYSGILYRSLVDANTSTPGSDVTKWEDAFGVFKAASKLDVATIAQMQVGTATDLLPSVAAVMSLFSKRAFGTNNYIRIPDVPGGLIIQWGLSTAIPAGSSGTVTFPIPFPSNVFIAVATFTDASSTTRTVNTNVSAKTLSAIALRNPDSASSQFNFIVLGN